MNDKFISFCDVAIKNGSQHIVFLYFDKEELDPPAVIFKSSSQFNDYYIKVAQSYGIPCLERKLFAKRLFDEAEEEKYIPEKFINPITELYASLPSFSSENEVDIFKWELNRNIFTSLGNLERQICNQAERMFFKCRKNYPSACLDDKDILARIEGRLETFADKCGLDLRINDTMTDRRDFYIHSLPMTEEPEFYFWQILIVSTSERKIYVGSRTCFREFEIKDAELALDYYTALFGTCNEKLRKDARRHCNEFKITSKSYDIAQSAIKTMLDLNRKNTGFEYNLNSNKIIMTIILEKDNDDKKAKKYEIVITCNEFLRAPKAFKDFIANPRRKNAWNFWCKEYKPTN